jgi:hypothetical protein
MAIINIEAWLIIVGLVVNAIFTGFGSAIGNILAKRWAEPHIKIKKRK